MLSLAAMVCCVVVAGPHTPGFSHGGDRVLVTRRAYPAAMADNVHRPGFNGRLFVRSTDVGPRNVHWPMDHGAEAYGAAGEEDARVLAKIGTEVVGFSPWTVFDGSGLKRYEAARQQWLKESGYVGGVRTFVNDAYLAGHMSGGEVAERVEATGAKKYTPRAIIELAPETTRFRKRMQVRVVSPDEQMTRSASVAVRVVETERVASAIGG